MGNNVRYGQLEAEEKRANFTSNQKASNVLITRYFHSNWVNFKSTIVLEHVLIKIKHLYYTKIG